MSATDDLHAAALAYAVSQGYAKPAPTPTPTPDPPPTPAPVAVDDKRAYRCTQISSTGWSYANPSPGVHTLAQSYNGVNVVPSNHPPGSNVRPLRAKEGR